jgi:hypothetical protein
VSTSTSLSLPLSLSLSLLPSCTALLAYPPAPVETAALCQNGIDDDGDGHTDCDDPDCARCVAAPRIACPDGWTAEDVPGLSDVAPDLFDAPIAFRTCTPPDDVLADCPSEAPPGARVAHAVPGGVLAALADLHDPSPDPSAPPIEVWLEPGTHVVESPTGGPLEVHVHLALHGLCAGGAHAVLAPAPGSPSAIRGDAALDLDHVELVLAEDTSAMPEAWSGAFTLTATIVSSAGGAPLFRGTDVGIHATDARIGVPMQLAQSRIELLRSRTSSIDGRDTEVRADRVEIRGDLTLAGLSTLDATSLFVACGRVVASEGATMEWAGGLVRAGLGAPPLALNGRAAFRSAADLADVALVTDARCAPATPIGPFALPGTYVLSDLVLSRVIYADAIGLDVGPHTSVDADDTTVIGSQLDVGARVVGGVLHGSRMRIRDALRAGLEVAGEGSAPTSVDLASLHVEHTGSASGTCVSPPAGIAVHRSRVAGTTALSVSVTLTASDVRGADGCALFVEPDVTTTLHGVAIDTSTIGVCAAGRDDATELAATVAPNASATPLDTTTACAGTLCPSGPGCGETDCTNRVDDDHDGTIDCADLDCMGAAPCVLAPEICDNGIDDDHDGATDCDDFDSCGTDPACTGGELDCTNGSDDDHDGRTDCADSDCSASPACAGSETGHCGNSVDDDADGLTDCWDVDCMGDPVCPESVHCNDGVDDDGNGLTDCADTLACSCDPRCGGTLTCPDGDLGSALGAAVRTGTITTVACSLENLSCAPEATGGSIALAWTAPAAGTYAFDATDTSGSGFDVILGVRETCLGAEIGCDHAGFPTFASRVTASLAFHQHVVIVLRSEGASIGEHFTLGITAM